MTALTVLRDEAVPYAVCPNCQVRLEIPSLEGTGWTIRAPSDVADRLLLRMGGLEREELVVLVLNTKNVVIRSITVYQGNVSASLVRVGELFRDAVRLNASGVILVHNHPSGDPTPSPDDLHLTAEALAAGRLLDIELLDHLVIGRDTFVSLRDRRRQLRPKAKMRPQAQPTQVGSNWATSLRPMTTPEPRELRATVRRMNIVNCKWDHEILGGGDEVELMTLRNPWTEIGGQPVMRPNPPAYVHKGEGIQFDHDYKVIDSGTLEEVEARRRG